MCVFPGRLRPTSFPLLTDMVERSHLEALPGSWHAAAVDGGRSGGRRKFHRVSQPPEPIPLPQTRCPIAAAGSPDPVAQTPWMSMQKESCALGTSCPKAALTQDSVARVVPERSHLQSCLQVQQIAQLLVPLSLVLHCYQLFSNATELLAQRRSECHPCRQPNRCRLLQADALRCLDNCQQPATKYSLGFTCPDANDEVPRQRLSRCLRAALQVL